MGEVEKMAIKSDQVDNKNMNEKTYKYKLLFSVVQPPAPTSMFKKN